MPSSSQLFTIITWLIALPALSVHASDLSDAWTLATAAITKASAEEDPRELLVQSLSIAMQIDPSRGIRLVRDSSKLIESRSLPPKISTAQSSLAGNVAQYHVAVRDELLERAIVDAQAALDETQLWQVNRTNIGNGIPYSDPQESRNDERQLLKFKIDLWDSVIRQRSDRFAAVYNLAELIRESEAAGYYGGELPRPFRDEVWREAARLDPDLLFEAMSSFPDRAPFIEFCASESGRRWNNGARGSFAGKLAAYVVNESPGRSGLKSVYHVYKYYDFYRAWELTDPTSSESTLSQNNRNSIRAELISYWARREPEAAFRAADNTSDETSRGYLMHQIALVWVQTQPHEVGRALKYMKNDGQRISLQYQADQELARRAGLSAPKNPFPPRPDTPLRRPETTPRPSRRGFARGPSPDQIRVENNPGDTAWLTGSRRQDVLREAAMSAYNKTKSLDSVFAITTGLTEQREIDDVFATCAQRIAADNGDTDHAIALLQRVKTARRFVLASCDIAQSLIRAAESEN